MYSEIFKLVIKNPQGLHTEEYLIDYNGNASPEEIGNEVKKFILKHGYFNSREFDEESLNDTSSCVYFPDVKEIKVVILESVWDIDAENIPF